MSDDEAPTALQTVRPIPREIRKVGRGHLTDDIETIFQQDKELNGWWCRPCRCAQGQCSPSQRKQFHKANPHFSRSFHSALYIKLCTEKGISMHGRALSELTELSPSVPEVSGPLKERIRCLQGELSKFLALSTTLESEKQQFEQAAMVAEQANETLTEANSQLKDSNGKLEDEIESLLTDQEKAEQNMLQMDRDALQLKAEVESLLASQEKALQKALQVDAEALQRNAEVESLITSQEKAEQKMLQMDMEALRRNTEIESLARDLEESNYACTAALAEKDNLRSTMSMITKLSIGDVEVIRQRE
ncbi:hypothetical protein FIBSPDRAFT_1005449 [Athelia psychrophila]|uniref:Uncharacterized protein n=1 Tax=Athelia psychrophila TaxID=1759441 RepID=A0A166PJX0_9AGAM|nr:hypothetical protein FIBSPDRAFT_1005449 [Fibularhizoctonia sp. CBS 109695]